MARSIKLLGAIALVATAACSTDPISPSKVAAAGHPANANAAATNSIVVTESDIARQPDNTAPTRSWVFYTSGPTPTGVFRSGPGDPPRGVGSFEMSTLVSDDHGTLFNFDHVNTRLEAGDFATLVFEPIYTLDQHAVVPGTWQTWDGYSGNWWSTRDLPGIARFVPYTWAYILSQIPNATILGGFGVNQGSGSLDLTAATDALTLGVGGTTWVYNFEPYRAPANTDECKNGGWETFKTADGSSFKNQGQCIKYVHDSQ